MYLDVNFPGELQIGTVLCKGSMPIIILISMMQVRSLTPITDCLYLHNKITPLERATKQKIQVSYYMKCNIVVV